MSKYKDDESWRYLKYSADQKRLIHLVNLLIQEDEPRYVRGLPEMINEVACRIRDYKLRKASIVEIDSYFDN